MDMVSYILGLKAGEDTVTLEGTEYTFTDTDSDGHIEIEEAE